MQIFYWQFVHQLIKIAEALIQKCSEELGIKPKIKPLSPAKASGNQTGAQNGLGKQQANDHGTANDDEILRLKALWDTKTELLSDNITKVNQEEAASAVFLQQKIKSLEAQWKSLSATADEILKIDNTREVLDAMISAQDRYDHGITEIQEKLKGIEQIQLPPAEIPIFDGSFHIWKDFYDNFMQRVHLNHELGSIQKMQYLKSYTKGEASKIIRHW